MDHFMNFLKKQECITVNFGNNRVKKQINHSQYKNECKRIDSLNGLSFTRQTLQCENVFLMTKVWCIKLYGDH